MYIFIQCYLNDNQEMCKTAEDAVLKIIPNLDTKSGVDMNSDDGGDYANFYYGSDSDEFTDDQGNEITDTAQLEKIELDLQIELLTYYLELFELKDKNLIRNFWIDDDSQSGYKKKKEFAEKDLFSLKEQQFEYFA